LNGSFKIFLLPQNWSPLVARIFLTTKSADDAAAPIRIITANDDQDASEVSTVKSELQQIAAAWHGEAVIIHQHPPTGSCIFVALHDTTLGPAAGGTRIKVYSSPTEGLGDALRLSEAMTCKWAIADANWGGGKAVLNLSHGLTSAERVDLLQDYAKLLNALDGRFLTAGDLGTTTEDLVYLSQFTGHVTTGEHSHGESVDSGTYTALGLRAATRASLAHAFGDASIRGRSVLVQGLGQVGGMLARLLVLDGARVLINDLDLDRLNQLQAELGCETVAADAVYEADCEVYAPCCTGGTINEETIARLQCRIICGGANNQLASPEMASRLHRCGILYAPDYVANAGGAIGLTMFGQGAPDLEIYRKIEAIETTLGDIFQRSSELSCSPVQVADEVVRKKLTQARAARDLQFNLALSQK
jgi:leucine dehydrogenase